VPARPPARPPDRARLTAAVAAAYAGPAAAGATAMILTSRIASGFDVELQLGGGWFATALRLWNEHGLLAPPGHAVTITEVQIGFEPGWDLQIGILGQPGPVLARVELDPAGAHLVVTTSMPGAPARSIALGVQGVSERPVLVKLPGDAEHEPALALLINLDIDTRPASATNAPPGGVTAPRGNAGDARSFLPRGKHIAVGMGRDTFTRFANNLWHTNLRAADGSHPLPAGGHEGGTWSRVAVTPEDGAIRLQLDCELPAGSPRQVAMSLLLTPAVTDGSLRYSIGPGTSADIRLLDELFRGTPDGVLGGVMSFVAGLFIGGAAFAELVRARMQSTAGAIGFEVAERIVDGVAQREVRARVGGEPLAEIVSDRAGVAHVARPRRGGGFDRSLLDAIPCAMSISTDHPGEELLYRRSLLVTPVYDEWTVDPSGFGVAGASATMEKCQPEIVALVDAAYDGDRLTALTYQRGDGRRQTLSIEEVFARAAQSELRARFQVQPEPEGAALRVPEGKLACVCLRPVAIRREDTVVRAIEFQNGLRLEVPDTVALQDAAALVVVGYQLIHARDSRPYYRARADARADNNFESLPEY
jgi:hypothetical protein